MHNLVFVGHRELCGVNYGWDKCIDCGTYYLEIDGIPHVNRRPITRCPCTGHRKGDIR